MPSVELRDDYYEILKIRQSASSDEIKKSYRRLALLYNPDKNKDKVDATASFQQLNAAYETLNDGRSRRIYDRERPSIIQTQRTAWEQAIKEVEAEQIRAEKLRAAAEEAIRAEAAHAEAIKVKIARVRAELARAEAEAAKVKEEAAAAAYSENDKVLREKAENDARDLASRERLEAWFRKGQKIERELFEIDRFIRSTQSEPRNTQIQEDEDPAEEIPRNEDARFERELERLRRRAALSIKEDPLSRHIWKREVLSAMLSTATTNIAEEKTAQEWDIRNRRQQEKARFKTEDNMAKREGKEQSWTSNSRFERASWTQQRYQARRDEGERLAHEREAAAAYKEELRATLAQRKKEGDQSSQSCAKRTGQTRSRSTRSRRAFRRYEGSLRISAGRE